VLLSTFVLCVYVVGKHRGRHAGAFDGRICLTPDLGREGVIARNLDPDGQDVGQHLFVEARDRTLRQLPEIILLGDGDDCGILFVPAPRLVGRLASSTTLSPWKVPTTPSAVRSLQVPTELVAPPCGTSGRPIGSNPALGVRYVPARKAEKAKRRSLTADDVLDIIAAMPDQWQCFFSLLAESGCRVAELLGLRWANVHLRDDPYVYVCEQFRNGEYKALKTEASRARVPLSAPMAQRLSRVRPEAADDAPVFPSCTGTPLNYSNLYNRVLIPALQRAGIGHMQCGRWDNEGVAFHAFRRACGSLLVSSGSVTPNSRRPSPATWRRLTPVARQPTRWAGSCGVTVGTPNTRRHPQTRRSRTAWSPHRRAFPQTPATSATD
jgi:Phage integrase family